MIYDTLNNLPNYLGVSDNLDTVIEYIMARDITTLPAGRTRIDGEKAVVTVSTVTPLTSDKALFQRHDNHITLETDLDGIELFEVRKLFRHRSSLVEQLRSTNRFRWQRGSTVPQTFQLLLLPRFRPNFHPGCLPKKSCPVSEQRW